MNLNRDAWPPPLTEDRPPSLESALVLSSLEPDLGQEVKNRFLEDGLDSSSGKGASIDLPAQATSLAAPRNPRAESPLLFKKRQWPPQPPPYLQDFVCNCQKTADQQVRWREYLRES